MKGIARLGAALLLAGCSASPTLTQPPVEVKPGELTRFWVPTPTERDIRVPAKAQEKGIPGRVVVEYVIDSEGKVVGPTVVSAEPQGVYNKAALAFIRNQRYRPAAGNGERLPVRTRTEITFNMEAEDSGTAY